MMSFCVATRSLHGVNYAMAGKLLPDELWNEIEPLFPEYEPSPEGGCPPCEKRTVLTVVLFVLKTGIGWNDLPTEAFGVSHKTCTRRINEWTATGLWQRMFAAAAIKYRFITSTSPRSQLRRIPPESQTWAKLRSTLSRRSWQSRLPLARRIRRRFSYTVRCKSGDLSVHVRSCLLLRFGDVGSQREGVAQLDRPGRVITFVGCNLFDLRLDLGPLQVLLGFQGAVEERL